MELDMELVSTISRNEEKWCFFCFELTNCISNNNEENKADIKQDVRQKQSELNFETSENDNLGSSASTWNLFRYLDTDPESLKGVELDTTWICQGCHKILDGFSTLFRAWEEMDMKLALLYVRPLEKRMRKSLSSLQNVSEIQENIIKKCLLKTKNYLPSVKTERTNPPPPVISEYVPQNSLDDKDAFHNSEEELEAEPEVEKKCFVDFNLSHTNNGVSRSKIKFNFLEAAYYKYNGEGPPPSFPLTPEAVAAEVRKGSVKIPSTSGGKTSSYKCKPCGKICREFGFFSEHYRASHLGLVHSCRKCHRTYKYRTDMVKHWRFCCGNPSPSLLKKELGGPGCCKICRKPFQRLKRHQQQVHSAHRFFCDLCSRTYGTLYDLQTHQRVAHLGYRYECKEPGCSKNYSYSNKLAAHIRNHHKLRGTVKEEMQRMEPSGALLNSVFSENELDEPETKILSPFNNADKPAAFEIEIDDNKPPDLKPEGEQKLLSDSGSTQTLPSSNGKTQRIVSTHQPEITKRNTKLSRQYFEAMFDKFVGGGPLPPSLSLPLNPEAVEVEVGKGLEKNKLSSKSYSYTCKKCGTKFPILQYFRDHFRSEHLQCL